MKILIVLFILSLFLVYIYKVKENFNNPYDSLSKATSYINEEIKESTDPERIQKLVNANNYINFIKTLFN